MMSLIKLPEDCLVEICLNLSVSELYILSCVNKKFYNLFKNERLWKLISARDFDNIKTSHRIYVNGYKRYKKDVSFCKVYKRVYVELKKNLFNGLSPLHIKYIDYTRMISDFIISCKIINLSFILMMLLNIWMKINYFFNVIYTM